jgi:glycosidase
MKKILPAFVLCLFASQIVHAQDHPKAEIIYHVFQRSFYDSNGDLQGDLKGLEQKLDYLQDLGVTSILLLPLYESVFYHNYFAIDFAKIDPEFGTMQDYIDLVKEVHLRHMKIYLDMETQYVTEDQLWWKDAFGNLGSKYSDYILWDDAAHTKPSSIVFGVSGLLGFDGTYRKITTANLYNKDVQRYNYALFSYFVDPNHDGKFDDGVDGFRLDHMMDDLDNKGRLTNLFTIFWTPLLDSLRKINPQLKIVAEQANWASYGFDYFSKADVDRVFAFGLQYAISTFDKKKIMAMADTILGLTPANKQQVVFIENHDMKRFASAVHKDPAKEKVGAAFNLLIGGLPSIYYGQEIGMFGAGGFGRFNNSDGNDIPQREAFEWYASDTGKGMGFWYKNTGAWWDSTNDIAHDGVSLEEEKNDPNSIYNYYKKLIALRQSNDALGFGTYKTIMNNNDSVVTFMRSYKNENVLVAVNLSSSKQTANITDESLKNKHFKLLFGDENVNHLSVDLNAYNVCVWQTQ